MTKRNEMQDLKRLLFATAEVSPATSMSEVNGIIADANKAAYDSLDNGDKKHILKAMDALQSNARRLGDAGALEVLSAIAQVMGDNNAP